MRLRLVCTAAAFAIVAVLAPTGTATADDNPSPTPTASADVTEQFKTSYIGMADGWVAANAGQPVVATGAGQNYYYDANRAVRGTTKDSKGKTSYMLCHPSAADGKTTCLTRQKGAKKWLKMTSTVTFDDRAGIAGLIMMYGMYGYGIVSPADGAVNITTTGDTTTLVATGTLETKSGDPAAYSFIATSSPTTFTIQLTETIAGQQTINENVVTLQRVPVQKKIMFPSKKLITTNLMDPGLQGR